MKQVVKKQKVLVSLSPLLLKRLDDRAKSERRTRSSELEVRLERTFKRDTRAVS